MILISWLLSDENYSFTLFSNSGSIPTMLSSWITDLVMSALLFIIVSIFSSISTILVSSSYRISIFVYSSASPALLAKTSTLLNTGVVPSPSITSEGPSDKIYTYERFCPYPSTLTKSILTDPVGLTESLPSNPADCTYSLAFGDLVAAA